MTTDEIKLSRTERFVRSHIQHYDEKKYWARREKVISGTKNPVAGFVNRLRLLYIKRCDAFNNASLGTHMGFGASFDGIPNLPHGLYGIIVSHNAKIGKNCTIFHQVTIGEGKGGAPVIGDNVLIGAGAKIIGHVRIGNGAKIGVNAVIVHDVPDGAVVVAMEGVTIK